MATSALLFVLVLLFGAGFALDCTQIPDSAIVPGHTVTVPAGAPTQVELPPNFRCTYNVKVPPMVYAHMRLENGLKGQNDLITVVDEQLSRTTISSRSTNVFDFYVYPNTSTTVQVVTKNVAAHSAFRLVINYRNMLNPTVTNLGNVDLKYFMLNDLQANSYMTPQTMVAKEQISVAVARSTWEYDGFKNFFIVDGPFGNPKAIYRMGQFVNQNFISTTNTVTVVGLDNRVSESSVVFTPLSQTLQFDRLGAIGTYFQANSLQLDSTSGLKKKQAVNVIAMNDYVTVLDVKINSNQKNCVLKAVTAPPTSSSEVLMDFTQVMDYRRNITRKSFSIISENCSSTFTLVSPQY